MERSLPERLGERFEVERLLTEGGFGQLWLARHRGLDRSVAIKVLKAEFADDPEQVARFLTEARITASVVHPGVIQILDHGADAWGPWIAYEYLEGRDLEEAVRTGPLPAATVLAIGHQVASALDAAHEKGVLHRDIKASNVIDLGSGRVKVLDFGIAKWTRDSAIRTRTGVILGTPHYMAPELIRGEPASPRTDLYALGALLYQLATGDVPFPGASVPQVLDGHLTRRPVPPSELVEAMPRSLESIILRALEKRPEDRFARALEMAQSLLDHSASPVPPAPGGRSRPLAPARPRPGGRRGNAVTTKVGAGDRESLRTRAAVRDEPAAGRRPGPWRLLVAAVAAATVIALGRRPASSPVEIPASRATTPPSGASVRPGVPARAPAVVAWVERELPALVASHRMRNLRYSEGLFSRFTQVMAEDAGVDLKADLKACRSDLRRVESALAALDAVEAGPEGQPGLVRRQRITALCYRAALWIECQTLLGWMQSTREVLLRGGDLVSASTDGVPLVRSYCQELALGLARGVSRDRPPEFALAPMLRELKSLADAFKWFGSSDPRARGAYATPVLALKEGLHRMPSEAGAVLSDVVGGMWSVSAPGLTSRDVRQLNRQLAARLLSLGSLVPADAADLRSMADSVERGSSRGKEEPPAARSTRAPVSAHGSPR